MNTKILAVIAIVLWGASATFFAFKFITGTTVNAEDGRSAIVLEAGERDFILTEMRGMLAAVQEIIAAANENDMVEIKKIAHRVGLAEVEGVPTETMLKLPMDFKKLGRAAHAGFDEVGLAADMGSSDVFEALEINLGRCVACHASYRLTTKADNN